LDRRGFPKGGESDSHCLPEQQAGGHVESAFFDPRTRVFNAIRGEANQREAGARFGVSAASVSRWRQLAREQGEPRSGPLGGDRRSERIEAHKDLIVALVEATPDITTKELRREIDAKGLAFGYGTIHRFFTRHGLTWKKRQAMPTNRIAPTF